MSKKARVSKVSHSEKKAAPPSFSPDKKAHPSKREFYSQRPRWRFHLMDWEFSRNELDARTCDSGSKLSSDTPKVECCFHLLSDRLKSYESMTWGEIIRDDKARSHFVSLADLKKKNRALHDKFMDIAINDGVDEPFSLRLEGRERLWGIVLSDGTFEAIYYDPAHKGWPVEKPHS